MGPFIPIGSHMEGQDLACFGNLLNKGSLNFGSSME